MKIVGIAGQIANGKDVLAEELEAQMLSKLGQTWRRRAWADGLKKVFRDSFGVDAEFTEKWKRDKSVPPEFDVTVRTALQQIGDGFRQIKGDVWIKWTLDQSEDHTIVTDCRYINELQAIKEAGGLNVLIYRPGWSNDQDHPSEAQLKPLVDFYADEGFEGPTAGANLPRGTSAPRGTQHIDYVIRNDSSIQELYNNAGMLLGFLQQELDLKPCEGVDNHLRRTFVPKGWGYEDWLVNKSEYCGKLLFFKKDRGCSWHYHKLKDETFYVHKGELVVIYSADDCVNENSQVRVLHAPIHVHEEFPDIKLDWVYRGLIQSGSANYKILKPGDTFHVPPGLRHAMYALEDTEMFEFSTEHFEEDSIRITKGD